VFATLRTLSTPPRPPPQIVRCNAYPLSRSQRAISNSSQLIGSSVQASRLHTGCHASFTFLLDFGLTGFVAGFAWAFETAGFCPFLSGKPFVGVCA
jgi:hypothetical protein